MGEVVLVRHGQASFGADDYDKLSPLGHQQAAWLGAYFRAHDMTFDHIWRGDLRRHRETAEGILTEVSGPAVEVDNRFDEFHYGRLEEDYLRNTGAGPAMSRPDFLEKFPAVISAWAGSEIDGAGESFTEFAARVESAVDGAVRPGENTLIVTSGGVIGMVLRRVLGLDVLATADLMLNIHNASLHRLSWEAGKLRLSLYNAIPHLDPADRAYARTYV